MIVCKNCGAIFDDFLGKCPYCKSPNNNNDDKDKKINKNFSNSQKNESFIYKYKDFISDEKLYQTALLELNVNNHYENALEMFRELAYRGHLDGMYIFADLLLKQMNPDKNSALKWLRYAASNGHQKSKIKLEMLDDNNNFISNNIDVSNSNLSTLIYKALPFVVSIQVVKNKLNGVEISQGSGFVIKGGFVVTNAHVIIGNINDYENGINQINSIQACYETNISSIPYLLTPIKIIPELDIAVLIFTGEKAKKVKYQDCLSFRIDNLKYGEQVYTIGNPLGVGLSVSQGVISSPNRDYGNKEFIQVDMAINHGNSGGALLDMNNNVIGMVSATPSNREDGMALCVPAKYIVQVLNKL